MSDLTLTLRITDAEDDVLILESQGADERYPILVTAGHAGAGPDGVKTDTMRRVGLELADIEALADYASTIAAARRCAEYRLQADDA